MTQQQRLFPLIQKDSSYLQLAGYLKYQPWVRFSDEIMSQLQEVLVPICALDGCENPEVVADWRECVRDERTLGITHRSHIILYRDGSDYTEEEEDGHTVGVALLFCREDIDQTTQPHSVNYRVHIPERTMQDKLLDACDFEDSLKVANITHLLRITHYLDLIINDQSKWTRLSEALALQGSNDDEED